MSFLKGRVTRIVNNTITGGGGRVKLFQLARSGAVRKAGNVATTGISKPVSAVIGQVKERVAAKPLQKAAVSHAAKYYARPAVEKISQYIKRPPTLPPVPKAAPVVRRAPRYQKPPRPEQVAKPLPSRMVRYGDAQQQQPLQPTMPQPVNVATGQAMPAPQTGVGKLVVPGLGILALLQFLG